LQRFGKVRFERQRPVATRNRFGVALELRQGDPAIAERRGEVGPERQHAVEARQRFGMAPELLQGDAAVAQRLGEVGLERERPVKARQCFSVALEPLQRHAVIVQRIGKVGLERQCVLRTRQRLVKLPQRIEYVGLIRVRFRRARVDRQSPPQQLASVLESSPLGRRHPKQMQRAEVARVDAKDALVDALRVRQLARLMQGDGAPERLGQGQRDGARCRPAMFFGILIHFTNTPAFEETACGVIPRAAPPAPAW
jgi:hypothetical protein